MIDRYGNSPDRLRFLRSLPKSWEQDNWADPTGPHGGAAAWAVVAALFAAAVVGWLCLR